MKNTLFGYSQSVAIELKLTLEDLCLLRWFDDFVQTGKMQVFEVDGESFYWVKYDYVVKQLTIIADDKRKMTKKLKRLVDLNLLDFCLFKKNGNYSLYKLNEENHKLLTEDVKNVLPKTVDPITENGNTLLPNNVIPITKNGNTLLPKTVNPITKNGNTNINLSNIHLSNNSSNKNTGVPAQTNIGDIANYINLSFENQAVRDKVFLFLENCASLKKAKNDNAVKVFVDRLKKYNDEEKIDLLERAIVGGWIDIFPRDDYSKTKNDKSTQPLADTSYDIASADKMWDKVPKLV